MSETVDRIGELIGDPDRRAAWRTLVADLHSASAPGGPLEGWVFHGTTEDVASLVAYEGVTTTESLAQAGGPDDWEWTQGTHWGSAKVAAFYAEDRIESEDDPDLDLAIVAVRLVDLEACGDFSADGQTIDCPLHSRLDRPPAETDALWEGSDKGWRACLDVLGTLLVTGPVPPGDVRILRSAACVAELVSEATPSPAVP